MNGVLHSKSNAERLHIQRALVGRDLTSIWDCVGEKVLSIGRYVANIHERLLKTAGEKLESMKKAGYY